MSSSRRKPALAVLYVYEPTVVESSDEVTLVRFRGATYVLGHAAVRLPAGLYRADGVADIELLEPATPQLELVDLADHLALLPELPQALIDVVGPIQRYELVGFLLEAQRFGRSGSDRDGRSGAPALLRIARHVDTHEPSFTVTSNPAAYVTVFDASGVSVAASAGEVQTRLAPGLYRLHIERGGFIAEQLIDHQGPTHLVCQGPRLHTPAPVEDAADAHDYYAMAARNVSTWVTWAHDDVARTTASLFVFVRRRARGGGPPIVPSEPLWLLDDTGRRMAVLDASTSVVDVRDGYLAFSGLVPAGTYRLRAGRSGREIAVSIPRFRAAHVFIADRGDLAFDQAWVSLLSRGDAFDPASRTNRALAAALAALASPERTPTLPVLELAPEDARADLCLSIAAAHLALARGDDAQCARLVEALERYDMIPDVAILAHAVFDAQARLSLSAPPLLRASLELALTHHAEFPVDSAAAHAASTIFRDSVWCTWSARPWDRQWIAPTIDLVRERAPDVDPAVIARRVQLPRVVVEQTLSSLALTMPSTSATPRATRVPGYQLNGILGRGAQGTVFRAVRERDQQAVALKIVPLLGGSEQQLRVERELELVRRLSHPRIITYTAWGALPEGDGLWLEMELCSGSLLDLLARRDSPLPTAEACDKIEQALEGLSYLHQRNVVHRDLKPGNLLIRADGDAALGDLGLAKALDDAGQLTATGRAGGTARFAPREQLLDFKRASPASDVWSMAATLYFTLTLDVPREEYAGQSDLEAAVENPVVPIRDRSAAVPESLARCLDLALASEPDRRPPDGRAFLETIRGARAI